ncbi:MAG: lysophospholipase [Lachnospiraceae bacterium]|nr:lysophospholipase [Lachnospiraceae bacterium]
MKKTTFYFDSRDGESKIYAVRYEPEEDRLQGGKPVAILQIIHGMAEYVERYEETAKFFTDRGFVVTGEDHLGHGKSVPEGGTYGYFCKQDPATVVVRDAHRLKKMTQSSYPGVPYFILGHSMGSFILRNYICRYGTGIQGAIIMGTGMPPAAAISGGKALCVQQKLLHGDKHVSKNLYKMAFAAYNARVPNARSDYDWVSKNEENVNRYIEDPLCGFVFTVNGFQTLFELISRMSDGDNLKKIPKELPLFLMSGNEDPVGEYGDGVKRVFDSLEALGMEHVMLKLYAGDRHEILNEADGEQVCRDINNWIMAKTGNLQVKDSGERKG